jgi:hypothetical protein
MKITTNTLNVLKNFAKINPSIVIQEGNVLKTISPSKTIMARAKVETEFNKKFALYSLDKFISTVSLFNDPSFSFGDKSVEITENNMYSNLPYSDESVIIKAPDKEINLPSVDASFKLTNDTLKNVEKAAGVLSLPEILIIGDGKNITLRAADTKNPSGDTFSVVIGDTDKVFKAIFKYENIKIIPGDYDVTISSKGISHFSGKEAEYWIAVEQNSTF